MDRILDYNNNLLTEGIENLVSLKKGNRIQRTLLDGTIHVQTIGTSMKEIKLVAYVRESEVDTFNDLYFSGAPIKIYYDNKVYTGTIIEEPSWEITVNGELDERMLSTELKIHVKTEGII